MASPVELLSRTNPVFSAYAFYAAILVLKMMAMSVLTARQRFRKKVFANPEDTPAAKGKVKFDDPDVERIRRGHLNDLENIPIFLLIALLYTLTDPSRLLAINLFRAFTVARILHTFVYTVVVIPQPSRALSWAVGYIITGYMAVQVVLSFLWLKSTTIFVVNCNNKTKMREETKIKILWMVIILFLYTVYVNEFSDQKN